MKKSDLLGAICTFFATVSVTMSLLLGASAASAETVIFGDPSRPTKATAVEDVNVNGTLYDVEFLYAVSTQNVYGPVPGDYDFNTASAAETAVVAVNAALNAQGALFVGNETSPVNIELLSEIYFVGFQQGPDIGPANSVDVYLGSIPDLNWIPSFDNVIYSDNRTWAVFTPADGEPPPPSGVDLTGTVQDQGGTPLCSLALASGQFEFTCNPNGPFSLTDLPREGDGSVKRQVYVDGFFPNVEVLQGSVTEDVVMTRAGTCADYNAFPEPGVYPGSNGKRINVSGKIVLQNSQEPVCAMVLANGQFDFTCDGSGTYSGTIPLDANGQYKLQVYAQGFAPMIQRFDEFTPDVEVRLARAVECQ